MFSAEIETLTHALKSERNIRADFGMDTGLLDMFIERAEALSQLDEATLAGMVEQAQEIVGNQREHLLEQLSALGRLG